MERQPIAELDRAVSLGALHPIRNASLTAGAIAARRPGERRHVDEQRACRVDPCLLELPPPAARPSAELVEQLDDTGDVFGLRQSSRDPVRTERRRLERA